jgi:hypothetical protein
MSDLNYQTGKPGEPGPFGWKADAGTAYLLEGLRCLWKSSPDICLNVLLSVVATVSAWIPDVGNRKRFAAVLRKIADRVESGEFCLALSEPEGRG